MNIRRTGIATAVLVAVAAATTGSAKAASIGDKPLPLLNGTEKARLLYSVTGVRDNPLIPIAASFHCTSTGKTGGKTIYVGVEVFEDMSLKNDVTLGEGVTDLDPGDTDVISTHDTLAFDENEKLNITVLQGSARILATSPKVICTAFLVDPDNNPPTFMTTLPMFKKTQQKGQ